MVDKQTCPPQLLRHPAVTVDGPSQRKALDMVPQFDVWIRRAGLLLPAVPGGAWQRESAAGASQCKRKAARSRLGNRCAHLPDPFSLALGIRTSSRESAF